MTIDQDYLAKQAITEVIHQYAAHIRTATGIECEKYFTDDAYFNVWQAPLLSTDEPVLQTKLEGKDTIIQYITEAEHNGTRLCPMIHNLIIEVNGNKAKANSILVVAVWPNGHQLIGEYEDHLELHAGQWKFASRVFEIHGQLG